MTYWDVSMFYEGEYGTVCNRIAYLNNERRKEINQAHKEGREPNPAYDEELAKLQKRKLKVRRLSDEAFLRHKELHRGEEEDDGWERLANAILHRASLDYEGAISKGDKKMKSDVERFARDSAHLYSRVDFEAVLWRIREKYEDFKKIAHREKYNIIETTERIRRESKKKFDYVNEELNPYRCPCCGGGLYAQTRLKSNTVLIKCSGCSLSEVVEVRS